jgi:hypothetical protein
VGKVKVAKGKKTTRSRAAAGKQPTLFDTSSEEEEVPLLPPPPPQAGTTTTKRKKAKARVMLPTQVTINELPPPIGPPMRKLQQAPAAVIVTKAPAEEGGRALRPRGPGTNLPAELKNVVPGVLASQSRLVGEHLTSAVVEFGSAFDRFEVSYLDTLF